MATLCLDLRASQNCLRLKLEKSLLKFLMLTSFLFFFSARYESTKTKHSRRLSQELLLGFMSSAFLVSSLPLYLENPLLLLAIRPHMA